MKRLLMSVVLLLVMGALLTGCGSKDEPKGQPAKSGGDSGKASSAAPAPPAGPLTPAQWTDSMVAGYKSAITDTRAALEGIPPADQALPKMKAVYEKCIQQHLPLGKQREAMSQADRAKADNSFAMKLMSLQSSDDFKAYIALSNGPYSPAKAKTDDEKELARLVRGINIISQYAQFELLKKQEPKEAERLGIQ